MRSDGCRCLPMADRHAPWIRNPLLYLPASRYPHTFLSRRNQIINMHLARRKSLSARTYVSAFPWKIRLEAAEFQLRHPCGKRRTSRGTASSCSLVPVSGRGPGRRDHVPQSISPALPLPSRMPARTARSSLISQGSTSTPMTRPPFRTTAATSSSSQLCPEGRKSRRWRGPRYIS